MEQATNNLLLIMSCCRLPSTCHYGYTYRP